MAMAVVLKRWAVRCGLVLGVGLGSGVIPRAQATAPRPYEAEIRAFEAADAAQPPPADPVLFVGSSTFALWADLAGDFPGFKVINRGFGGSQFSDVLHFFDRVVAAYRPGLVVVYEGDNDLAGGLSVDRVFADWTNFVGRVERELPGTGVLFAAVKPSPSRRSILTAQQALNARIAEDCAHRPGCRVVDVATPMLDETGEPRPELFLADRLHMNAAGYALWRERIAPELEGWASAHPERSVRKPAGALLVDFGGPEHPSGGEGVPEGPRHWNNITTTVAANNQGRLAGLVAASGERTEAAWVMTSRFNGVNQNGTTSPAPFPTSATRDSMFGNTETFSGLANVTPAFRIEGLRPGVPINLTFYASRTGVNDNRETRYTVTGATTAFTDLNAANNVNGTASVTNIVPDSEGRIAIALTPGPRNNNSNHFTYLGALMIEEANPGGRVFLFDVGGADSPTGGDAGPPVAHWNDLTLAVGADVTGALTNLVTTDGTPTAVGLRIESPFDTADTTGATTSTAYASSATRDSLAGRGGTPGGVPTASPAFRFTGLDPGRAYSLGFHASRAAAAGPVETRYLVRGHGETEVAATLEPAGNTNRTAWVTGMIPDDTGTFSVRLAPGPGNESTEGRVFLGVLRLEWRERETPPAPSAGLVSAEAGRFRFRIHTARGRSCRIESSDDLTFWRDAGTRRPGDAGIDVEVETAGTAGFFRLIDQP